MDPQTQVWVRRSRRGTAESRGVQVGLEGLSCVQGGLKGPGLQGASRVLCTPPPLPLAASLSAGLAALQTISCLLFAPLSQSPLGSPLCSGLHLLPSSTCSLLGGLATPWKSPTPAPHHEPAFLCTRCLPSGRTSAEPPAPGSQTCPSL